VRSTEQPAEQSISCEEKRWFRIRRTALAGALPAVLVVTIALASDARVPYVPTPQGVVDRMLEMAKVGPADYLVDLGSGDGRIVVTAAKQHGARGFGVDLNPDRIKEANDNARRAGVTDKVSFQQRNLFDADLSLATVITMYLLPRVNLELRPRLLALAPGTRLVSHDFNMGDWKPDAEATMRDESKFSGAGGESDIYLWIVPEKAAGTWRWQGTIAGKPQSYEIRLEQQYQVITGSVWLAGRTATLREAKLRGAEISFNFTLDVNGVPVRQAYNGRIEGDSIIGTTEISGPRIQAQVEWSASRGARSASAPHPSTHRTALN
jgi:SAM-dependent methyltransferase